MTAIGREANIDFISTKLKRNINEPRIGKAITKMITVTPYTLDVRNLSRSIGFCIPIERSFSRSRNRCGVHLIEYKPHQINLLAT